MQIEVYNKNNSVDTLIGSCSYALKPLLGKIGQVLPVELPLHQGGSKQQGTVKLKICCEDKGQRSTASTAASAGDIISLNFEGIQAMDQDDGGLGSW